MLIFGRRTLLALMLLAGGLAAGTVAPAVAEPADEDETKFSAAIYVINQGGQVGPYELFSSARCMYHNQAGSPEETNHILRPVAQANPPHSSQEVGFRTLVYQRLATGTRKLVYSTDWGTKVVDDVNPTTIPVVDHFLLPGSGPDFILAYEFMWYQPNTNQIEGWVIVGYSNYEQSVAGSNQSYPDTPYCSSLYPPSNSVSDTTGTVNSTFDYTIYRFPWNVTVLVRWDGEVINSVGTNGSGREYGSLTIPADTIGAHTIQWKYGKWVTSRVFTVKPRIKIIPNDNISRGESVTVSLRGFAANQTVYIRWKKGGSYQQINHVMTSGTGSASIVVHVPHWVPDGATSVRGESGAGNAQTNDVTVSGGTFNPATAKTPTPTPTQTATSTVTATATPTTTATTEASPTAVVVTETATLESTATVPVEMTLTPDASPVQEST
jgi:hypothetical protein